MFHTDLNIIIEMKLVNIVLLLSFKIYMFTGASQGFDVGGPSIENISPLQKCFWSS